MKRLAGALLVVGLMAAGCGGDKKAGSTGGDSKWPEAMKIQVDPKDGQVKIGKKAEISLVNGTGAEFQYEWKSRGKCKGKLTSTKDSPMSAQFVAGQEGKNCEEEIEVTIIGGGKSFSKTLYITTIGDPKFEVLEVRPEPIPENWKMINDFSAGLMEGKEVECVRKVRRLRKPDEAVPEGSKDDKFIEEEIRDIHEDIRYNKIGGIFDTWGFEFGKCTFEEPEGDDKDVLVLKYLLPQLNSYCGMFEQFKMGEDCEAIPFDISGYDKITFILKSGDKEPRYPILEIVSWAEFTQYHQGAVESTLPLEAPVDQWKRYEIKLSSLLKDENVIDPKKVKSIGFRINRKGVLEDGTEVSNGAEGTILIDNVALIKKD